MPGSYIPPDRVTDIDYRTQDELKLELDQLTTAMFAYEERMKEHKNDDSADDARNDACPVSTASRYWPVAVTATGVVGVGAIVGYPVTAGVTACVLAGGYAAKRYLWNGNGDAEGGSDDHSEHH